MPALDIRAMRINRGLSVEEAADQIGVATMTLRRAEEGKHRPRASNAFKIASFYNHKVTDIWPVAENGSEAA